MLSMTPREIVQELDRHIIGQNAAKKAVAIALRNRWRRMQLEPTMRAEVMPKNILMIGPTGVGKTEIARRLAKLAQAPFIKVEATKFTEVGYVGRDVDSIIRDLIDIAMKMTRDEAMKKVNEQAWDIAEEKILDILLPRAEGYGEPPPLSDSEHNLRQKFRKKLREGELDDKEVEIEVKTKSEVHIMMPPGLEDMSSQFQSVLQNISGRESKRRKMPIKKAFKILTEQEAEKLVNEEEIKIKAIENTEQNGIVFIDEIDKIVHSQNMQGADVSGEGVQRDLLPLVEGSTINTKYGAIKTDHILFIASGAFHLSKPSDLIPELQGRLPIRVELQSLMAADFVKILTEPDASLTAQYKALLSTEDVELEFSPDGIEKIAQIAWQVNNTTENIGARRLHTIVEKLLEEISFHASDQTEKKLIIDKNYVEKTLESLAANEDLSRYIL